MLSLHPLRSGMSSTWLSLGQNICNTVFYIFWKSFRSMNKHVLLQTSSRYNLEIMRNSKPRKRSRGQFEQNLKRFQNSFTDIDNKYIHQWFSLLTEIEKKNISRSWFLVPALVTLINMRTVRSLHLYRVASSIRLV